MVRDKRFKQLTKLKKKFINCTCILRLKFNLIKY